MMWAVLGAASIALAALLQRAHVPAAWLIGPMVVAIALAIRGFRGRMPPVGFTIAQALIAVTVSQTITAPILIELATEWAPIVTVVLLSVAAAGISGWLLARYSAIAPETAAWGSTPGGATTMIVLAADFGADPRLVAFMQYLRVTLVVLSASTVSRLLLGGAPQPHGIVATGPFDPAAFLTTLAFATIAGLIGRYSRVPGGQFLIPLVVAGVLHATGILHPYAPWWLLDAAYATIGLSIGLLWTRETLLTAVRILPTLLVSTTVLIVLSAAAGMLLVLWAHVDPMTAYLATTPGGLDSVPVIALDAGTRNLPLILTAQTIRVFVVVATGPLLAKLILHLTARVEKRAENDQGNGLGAQDTRAERDRDPAGVANARDLLARQAALRTDDE
jgi:membrane AbrB-like protein